MKLLLLIALVGCAPAGKAGPASCADCHAEQARHVEYGPHRSLACAECHGPGDAHMNASDPRPRMFLGGANECIACHVSIRSLDAHLRDVERLHKVTLDRDKVAGSCAFCHDPHLLE